ETERDQKDQSDVKITLPLPLMVRAGGRYRDLRGTREVFDVELDVEYETWSRVQAFALETDGLTATVNGAFLPIGEVQIAKQWQDVFSVKLGGDVNLVPDRFTLR